MNRNARGRRWAALIGSGVGLGVWLVAWMASAPIASVLGFATPILFVALGAGAGVIVAWQTCAS